MFNCYFERKFGWFRFRVEHHYRFDVELFDSNNLCVFQEESSDGTIELVLKTGNSIKVIGLSDHILYKCAVT